MHEQPSGVMIGGMPQSTKTQTRPHARRRHLGAVLSLCLAGGAAVALAPGAVAAPHVATARVAAATPKVTFPPEIALPTGCRPEGIAAGTGNTVYAGSVSDGSIVSADIRTGRVGAVVLGVTGRSLRGMQYDPRSGLLWTVGSDGATAKIFAVNPRSKKVVRTVVVPGGTFLNDLVITRRAIFVTDSSVDRLTKVPLASSGQPTNAALAFVALTGAWPKKTSEGIRANGIRALSDGSLVLNNSTRGGLYAVDPLTGVTKAIPVTGPAQVSGDGLELRGSTLYNVRGSGESDVSVLTLRHGRSGWRATATGRLASPRLSVPSTATLAGGALYAVNARFGVADPDNAAYWIKRLPLRPRG